MKKIILMATMMLFALNLFAYRTYASAQHFIRCNPQYELVNETAITTGQFFTSESHDVLLGMTIDRSQIPVLDNGSTYGLLVNCGTGDHYDLGYYYIYSYICPEPELSDFLITDTGTLSYDGVAIYNIVSDANEQLSAEDQSGYSSEDLYMNGCYLSFSPYIIDSDVRGLEIYIYKLR